MNVLSKLFALTTSLLGSPGYAGGHPVHSDRRLQLAQTAYWKETGSRATGVSELGGARMLVHGPSGARLVEVLVDGDGMVQAEVLPALTRAI